MTALPPELRLRDDHTVVNGPGPQRLEIASAVD
jgi:hypothetical protein